MPIDNTSLNISSIKRIARGRLKGNWKTAFFPTFIITLMTGIPALFDSVLRSAVWVKLLSDDSWMVASDFQAIMEAVNKVQITGPAAWINTLLSLFSFLCSGALAVSMATLSLQIIRREQYTPATAFSGFSQFARAFIISLLIMIFSFLWGMVTLLPATVVFTVGLAMESPVMALLGTIILITACIGYILIILRYSMAYFIASDDRVIPASHVTANSVFLMRRRTGNFFLLELSFIGWLILAAIPLSIGIVLMISGYLAGFGSMILIGMILSAISMIPLAFVSLYISTAEAVYYSTISGNYNLNVPAGQTEPIVQNVPGIPTDFSGRAETAGQAEANPQADAAGQAAPSIQTATDVQTDPAGQTDLPSGTAGTDPKLPDGSAAASAPAAHKDFPEELDSPDPYSADPEFGSKPASPHPSPTDSSPETEANTSGNAKTVASGGADAAAAPDVAPATPDAAPAASPAHAYFPDSLSSENPYDPDPKLPSDSAGK